MSAFETKQGKLLQNVRHCLEYTQTGDTKSVIKAFLYQRTLHIEQKFLITTIVLFLGDLGTD